MSELAEHASSEAHTASRLAGVRVRPGRASSPGAGAGVLTALPGRRASATYLRCGGCGATSLYAQRKPGYGRLVHGFLGRHEQCVGAVEISAVRHPSDLDSDRAALALDRGAGPTEVPALPVTSVLSAVNS
jgi:hypothetical protein